MKHSWDEPGKVVNGKGGTGELGIVCDADGARRYARRVGEPLLGQMIKESVVLGDVPCIG